MSFLGTQLAFASEAGLLIGTIDNQVPSYRKNLEINQISANMHRNGSLFKNYEDNSNGFEYPKGSGKTLFRAVDLQLGIIRDSSIGTREIFSQELYVLNYMSGPYNTTNRLLGDRYLIEIDQSDIDQHRLNYNQPNYQAADVILNWPAIGDSTLNSNTDLAPFVDLNQNNCYEPLQGEYPLIKGDRAIYWINHPIDDDLPLEFHWMLYGYNDPVDTFLNRTIFLELRM